MSAPAFQFYPRDYIMSTRTLTPEQRGVYIDLLCFAWDGDGLPDSTSQLAAMAGISEAKFKRVWAELASKWVQGDDGRWRNPRQEQVRDELGEYRAAREIAAKKAAHKRWGHTGEVEDCEICQGSQAA